MRDAASFTPRISRRAIATKVIAGVVVVIIVVAGVAGYLLLSKPGSKTGTGTNTTSSSSPLGFSPTNPVSGIQLYNLYGLSGIPSDYKPFTNHTIYATGNLTSIINFPKPQGLFGGDEVETGVATNGNDFEYWYWGNSTGLPTFADNQQVKATCFDLGLSPYGNGSSILYMDNCALVPTG
jgi:hypothetical protein